MTKLTPALKKSITSDWQAMLPQFAAFQPLGLARRIGPLVQGVCLDRDSSNAAYLPTLHVHCLCRPFPVLSLNLGQPLLSSRSGTAERISVQFHDTRSREACTRLVASSLLPVEGDWRLAQVLEAHAKYRRLERPDARYPVPLMEDAVSVCAWLGKPDEAAAQAARHIEEAKGWPENILVRQGGLEGWRKTLNTLAESGDELRKVVAEQIEALKLQRLPVSQLVS
jgi:hypothetical protein